MPAAAGPDGRGDARGAGDGLVIKIDGQAVLGKVTFHRRWRLHLDAAVDAGVFHALNQLAGAVGGIAVDRRLAAVPASGPRPAGVTPVSRPPAPVPALSWACGSTVEITRSGATRRAILNTPAASWSRSWPVTVASSSAACASAGPSSWPSSHLEDPVRPRRPGQPGAHIHQHRMHEPRIAEVQPPGRVLPPGIEREPVHRLPVRAALDSLQHHHHRHDHRRHRPPPGVVKQVGEHLIREQPEALPVQDPVDRVRRHPPLAVRGRRGKQVSLPWRHAQRHQPPREQVLQLQQFSRNDQRTRRTATREKHQQPRARARRQLPASGAFGRVAPERGGRRRAGRGWRPAGPWFRARDLCCCLPRPFTRCARTTPSQAGS